MKSKKTLLSKISSNNLRIRYIKLGEGGKWAKDCFENNIIRLGYNSGSDEIYLNGINRKWEKIREYWLAEGKTQNTASSFSNQTREFFYDNGNTLWITFEDGFLYYGFSDGKKITQELPKGKNNNPTTFRQRHRCAAGSHDGAEPEARRRSNYDFLHLYCHRGSHCVAPAYPCSCGC